MFVQAFLAKMLSYLLEEELVKLTSGCLRHIFGIMLKCIVKRVEQQSAIIKIMVFREWMNVWSILLSEGRIVFFTIKRAKKDCKEGRTVTVL